MSDRAQLVRSLRMLAQEDEAVTGRPEILSAAASMLEADNLAAAAGPWSAVAVARNRDLAVVECMKRYGGSFVASIAEALLHADPTNFAKLKATFPDYWREYERMVS